MMLRQNVGTVAFSRRFTADGSMFVRVPHAGRAVDFRVSPFAPRKLCGFRGAKGDTPAVGEFLPNRRAATDRGAQVQIDAGGP